MAKRIKKDRDNSENRYMFYKIFTFQLDENKKDSEVNSENFSFSFPNLATDSRHSKPGRESKLGEDNPNILKSTDKVTRNKPST